MCTHGLGAIVTRMARTSITIVLELDEAMDSPSGSARLPGGTTREFHGWLGLTEAIDSLVRTPDPHHLGSSPSSERHFSQSERSKA